jgi:N6-adenosine-specific RNA methylase IME4
LAKGRSLALSDESIRHDILAPRMEQSRKPNDVHEAIDRIHPTASKIELFARRPYKNWDVGATKSPTTTAPPAAPRAPMPGSDC